MSFDIFIDRVHEEDRQRVQDAIRVRWNMRKIYDIEYRTIWPDGSQHWVYAKGQAVYTESGTPLHMLGIAMDITARKEGKEEARANQARIEAQHYLLDQREQERLRLARDLHDGPVQELIAATFSLKCAIDMAAEAGQKEILQIVLETVQKEIGELRDYAGDLRPPTITKFGLAAAVRSHTDTFKEKYPIWLLDWKSAVKACPCRMRLAWLYSAFTRRRSITSPGTPRQIR